MSTVDVFALLQTIAQIAVAFAGFGGIASGLRQESKSDDTRVDAGRLINMLTISLVAMGDALAPCFLSLFALQPDWLWRGAAIIALILMAILTPGVLGRSGRMRKFAGFDRLTAWINNALATLSAIAFALCALGIPTDHLAGAYVGGVVSLLTMSALLFFRVTLSVLRPHAPD